MICQHCGKEFEPKNAVQKYCSPKCSKRASSRMQVARLTAERRARHGKFVCAFCGKEFEPKNTLAKYCSRRCIDAAHRRRHGIMPRGSRKGTVAARPRRGAALPVAQPVGPDESKIRAYLALPAAERWARRGELTEKELSLAEKIYNENHATRTTAWNWLPR